MIMNEKSNENEFPEQFLGKSTTDGEVNQITVHGRIY